MLTSALLRELTEPGTGERRISRALVHSRPSFSFRAWRSSGTERLREASEDIVVAATQKCGWCRWLIER